MPPISNQNRRHHQIDGYTKRALSPLDQLKKTNPILKTTIEDIINKADTC